MQERIGKKITFSLAISFYSLIGDLLLKLIYFLNQWFVKGESNYHNILKSEKSVLVCCWHGQLLSVVKNLSGNKYYAIAGTHRDAEIISKICKKWKFKMIRGSSKERGSIAFKKILSALKKPSTLVFITPDGPTGPARQPKEGIIRAAQISGSAIIPVTSFSDKRWVFKNWDDFFVEKPFGKIHIMYGSPFYLKKNMDKDQCKRIIIKKMKNLEENNLEDAKIK
tara:strand:- start:40830 stop:41501 length:672 start_codon:yes stop_codon:yes gene_type:complete